MDGYPKIKLKIYENCSTIGVEISEHTEVIKMLLFPVHRIHLS